MITSSITLVIPGVWEDEKELLKQFRENDYLVLGNILRSLEEPYNFNFEILSHEQGIENSFYYASRYTFDQEILNQLNGHNSILILERIDTHIGSLKALLDLSDLVLQLGGIAIKVETTGIAYKASEWNELVTHKDLQTMYSYLVGLVHDTETNVYYSFGMKTFGLADARVSASIGNERACDTLHEFNLFRLMDSPRLLDGETIALVEEGQVFMLQHNSDTRYEREDIFHNRFGIWELVEQKY